MNKIVSVPAHLPNDLLQVYSVALKNIFTEN